MSIFDESSSNPLVDQRSNIDDKSNYDFLQDPTGNPLGYFDKGSSFSGWGAGTALDNAANIAEGIQKGDWVAVGISGAGVVFDAVGAATDPIGFVAGQLFGWMLEHLEPLRAVMHALTANPDMVKGYAATWENVEKEIRQVGVEYSDIAKSGTADWQGLASDAYHRKASATGQLCEAAANTAKGMATASSMIAEVVNAVRGLVRDLTANLLGALVSYSAELACTAGAATPVVVAQALTKIATTGGKVASILAKLALTISDLGLLLGALKNVADGINKVIQDLLEGI